MESRTGVEGYRRVAETRWEILLRRQSIALVNPTDNVPGIEVLAWSRFGQRFSGDGRKGVFIVIFTSPTPLYECAKVFEELH